VPALTETVAERVGAEVADTPESLINSGVEGIVIAAATNAHPKLIRAGVDAGIPVFCEKPLSGELSEAAAIARYVNDRGAVVQIGYPRRFDPAFAAARRAVEAGELGWVHTVRSTTLDPAPAPREYIEVSGGIFRDCSVHDFDTVRWLTGREPVEVYAAGTAHGADFFAEFGDVATATTLITFDDGATGVVTNTRYNARGKRRAVGGARCRGQRRRRLGGQHPLAESGRAEPGGRVRVAGRTAGHVLHGPAR
jgi:myo-inositol 2-dehydrogenase/D-chiro-inositol 1-dehydrogenase